MLKTLTGYKPLTLSLSLSQHVRFFQLHHETGSHPIEVTFLWPYWRQWSGIRGQYLRTMYICILFSKFIAFTSPQDVFWHWLFDHGYQGGGLGVKLQGRLQPIFPDTSRRGLGRRMGLGCRNGVKCGDGDVIHFVKQTHPTLQSGINAPRVRDPYFYTSTSRYN